MSTTGAAPGYEEGWSLFRKMGSPRTHVAPMVDQSELAFRTLCRRHGAESAYTPMLHARLFLENEKYRAEHFTTARHDRPLFVQFCANDPKILLGAARLVEKDCDAVDINLGCPQRIAKKGKYGAFLMDDLPTVEALVKALHSGLAVPVTCKIRLFPELEKTLAYAKMLESAGCAILAVHGRTRAQKDTSAFRADWDAIKAVREAVSIPVIANGDIRHLGDVDKCIEYTGATGVMSAGPLLVNPALFSRERWEREASGTKTSPWECCDLLEEYVTIIRGGETTPIRMVKAHTFKLLGAWLREFTDIREKLNQPLTLDIVVAVAQETRLRIKGLDRDFPIPKLKDKKKEAEEKVAAREAAIAEQKAEDDAIAALDAKRKGKDAGKVQLLEQPGEKKAKVAVT